MTRGIRLEAKKDFSLIDWSVRRIPPPEKVRIPFNDFPHPNPLPGGEGRPPEGRASLVGGVRGVCVEVGRRVRSGEKIAEPEDREAAALHASISGEVTQIREDIIEIRSDRKDERLPEIGKERRGWQDLGGEEIWGILRETGTPHPNPLPFWGRGLPAGQAGKAARRASLAGGRGEGGDTLIVDACEPEPYVSSDYALMMSHPVEILKGAEILRKVYGAERVMIATQEDKMEAAELLKSKIYFLKWRHFEVAAGEAVYPSPYFSPRRKWGQEIQGQVQESGADLSLNFLSPFSPATAFAAYEAVALQKPFYERAVTVAGECVIEPRHLWLRIGTSFEDAIKACRGLMREPAIVLRGGPMTGEAVATLDAVVTHDTTAVLALPKEVIAKPAEVEPCIRCGRCVEVCPAEISPAMITLAAERELFDLARDYGAEYCIECGNCSFICPSRRPMLELMQYAQAH